MPKTAWIDLGNGRKRLIPDVDKWLASQQPSLRSDAVPVPYMTRDTMDATLNTVDGKLYDSKSRYYGAIREASARDGAHYEIAGNDSSLTRQQPRAKLSDRKQDIADAIEQLGGMPA